MTDQTTDAETRARQAEILIVEDNFLTAAEVSDMVRDCGYQVAGTVARVNRGLDLLAEKPIDGAIIDINLDGADSFPLAAELARRKVPYCFLTGFPDSIIPADLRGAPRLAKPADREQIRLALDALLPHRRPLRPSIVLPKLQPQPAPTGDRGNHVLKSLDAAAWAALEPRLDRVHITAGKILEEPGERPAHLVFPITAAISLEAGAGKDRLQMALVGHEGMTGTALLLDGVAALRAVVQFGGEAWRVPADALAHRLDGNRELHRQLLRGVNGFIANLSSTALANGRGTIEQRLACWLLATTARLDTELLAVTHETLSQVLGVRRAGVTVALHVLEGKGALRSERRRVRLLDREKLIAAAGPYRPPPI